jgi:hypothetical protein
MSSWALSTWTPTSFPPDFEDLAADDYRLDIGRAGPRTIMATLSPKPSR